jgi:hypothetical protein
VAAKRSLATMFVAVRIKSWGPVQSDMHEHEPVLGYRSNMTTSLPVAPGTEYLKMPQLTLREGNKVKITSKDQ